MRRVLVTGASRGIGFEFVRQLLARGDQVYATCRHPDSAAALRGLKVERLRLITLDVADPLSIETAYAAVRAHTDALDLLINNAGILLDDDQIGDLTFDDLLHILRVNAVGPLLIAQRFLDLLRRGSDAKIIGITSEYGSIALKPDGSPPGYAASKAALNSFTRSLAFETRSVMALVIDPGWVRTDMGGRHASLTPEKSVDSMIRVIDGLSKRDNGKFFRWDGREMPW